jgi:hypothetical protein
LKWRYVSVSDERGNWIWILPKSAKELLEIDATIDIDMANTRSKIGRCNLDDIYKFSNNLYNIK